MLLDGNHGSHPVTFKAGNSTVSIMPDTADTVIWAPDDGCIYHPKHVEQFTNINKLYCCMLLDNYWHIFHDARTLEHRRLSGGLPHPNSVRMPSLPQPPHFHEILYWLLYLHLQCAERISCIWTWFNRTRGATVNGRWSLGFRCRQYIWPFREFCFFNTSLRQLLNLTTVHRSKFISPLGCI
jgi:hypothetical protein